MKLLERPIYAYSRIRSLHFASQFTTLNLIARLMPGESRSAAPLSRKTTEVIRDELFALLRTDARNIAEGTYPMQVLKPESPFAHLGRFPKLLSDGVSMALRKSKGKTTQFKKAAQSYSQELPKYYRRNFHFQTDGYLSEASAELYEHQVEILFAGASDAMRRLILSPLKEGFRGSDGTGLRFLEIAAGTGRASRFTRLAFPKAKIVVSDLSDPYLKVARKRLAGLDRLDFVQAAGEALPFQDQQFDAVYSVFLFHELPLDVREAVLKESRRVLKKGGFLGMVDSLQSGDQKAFDPLLDSFPKSYHEPFFRNYLAHPLEKLLKKAGVKSVKTRSGFFSKAVWGRV